jgi:hypothetical protein
MKPPHSGQPVLRCSFCQKSQVDVRRLIAGPSVFICDECLEVCNEIMADDSGQSPGARVTEGADLLPLPQVPASPLAVRCALCRMVAPVDDCILIENRGVLCPGCIGEIEAALAQRSEQES